MPTSARRNSLNRFTPPSNCCKISTFQRPPITDSVVSTRQLTSFLAMFHLQYLRRYWVTFKCIFPTSTLSPNNTVDGVERSIDTFFLRGAWHVSTVQPREAERKGPADP